MATNNYYTENYCSEYTHNDSVPIRCLSEQCVYCRSYQRGTFISSHTIMTMLPKYPVPALASTSMVLMLGHPAQNVSEYAWDSIWRNEEELKVLPPSV